MIRKFDSLDHLGLTVSNVRRSYEFYRDFVGLREGSFDDEFGEVWAGATIIGLLKGEPGAGPVHFGFREPTRANVDAWAEKALAAGVRVSFGPARADWGAYEVILHDPDGYEIQIWSDER